MKALIRWHGLRHPREMGAAEVERFLTHLAADRHVSPATHRRALSALLYLYREVVDVELPELLDEVGGVGEEDASAACDRAVGDGAGIDADANMRASHAWLQFVRPSQGSARR